MINTRIIDETFDTGSCQNYILSIQCSLNGFSFLIFDTISNKFIVQLEKELVLASPFELKNELDKLFKSEAILNQSFKKEIVSFVSLRSLLVPGFLESTNEKKLLLEAAFDKETDEIILDSIAVEGSSKLIYSVPGVLYRSIKEQYPECVFAAPALSLIKYGFEVKTPTLFVARFADVLYLLYIGERKIYFLNQYYVKNDSDCLYYILNVAKQLGLDQKTTIHLLGKISQKSILVNMLRNYFENVVFAPADKRCAQGLVQPTGHEHYYVPQFELTLCE